MTESSLLARTLWSLRSVEAVVSLLSASEIFLLLSSWSERIFRVFEKLFHLSPSNKQQHWFGKEFQLAWEDSQIYSPKVILKAILKAWLGALLQAELMDEPSASSLGFGSNERARTEHKQGTTPCLLVSMRHIWQALPNPNFHRAVRNHWSHGVCQIL